MIFHNVLTILIGFLAILLMAQVLSVGIFEISLFMLVNCDESVNGNFLLRGEGPTRTSKNNELIN